MHSPKSILILKLILIQFDLYNSSLIIFLKIFSNYLKNLQDIQSIPCISYYMYPHMMLFKKVEILQPVQNTIFQQPIHLLHDHEFILLPFMAPNNPMFRIQFIVQYLSILTNQSLLSLFYQKKLIDFKALYLYV